MNAELEQNMAILMGNNVKPTAKQLSTEEKKQLSDAYFKLFFGLAGANWARAGQTLGAAWYQALGQIKAMMGPKDKSNPAAMYLNQILAAHNAKWSEIMMTHPNKDKIFECSPEARTKWNSERAKQIGDAMGVINGTIGRHQAKEKAPQKNAPGNQSAMSQQKMKQQILLYMAAQQKIKAA